MRANSPQELFINNVKDLFDAEKQATRIMPKMAKSVSDEEVRSALQEHLNETKGQIRRLEQVFESLNSKSKSHPCLGMKGLADEMSEIMSGEMADELMTSAVVDAGRKQEHYEIAAYEAARSMAQALGMKEAAQLLQQNLEEEIRMDKRLMQASKRLLKEAGRANGRAATPSPKGHGRGRTANARTSGKRVSKMTIDHDEIRRWAEERGAHPACVRRTGGKGDIGMIRLDFPGYSGSKSLEPIDWDEFFQKFEDSRLALVYEESTSRGQKSNFNKLVSRESMPGRRTRAAG